MTEFVKIKVVYMASNQIVFKKSVNCPPPDNYGPESTRFLFFTTQKMKKIGRVGMI